MKKSCIGLLSAICLVILSGCGTKERTYNYPVAHKDIFAVDDFHGTLVSDPYRWLEDADSYGTTSWVKRQNKLTNRYLADAGDTDDFKNRLTELYDYPRYSAPSKKADRYFFYKNTGLQKQSVLYYQDSLNGKAKTLINPNALSEDGTIALSRTAVSKDGKLIAYGLSKSGSDWQTVHIRNVDSGKDFADRLDHCRHTRVSWLPDSTGFYYTRYPDPSTVAPEDKVNFNRICYHKLGTKQSTDKLIYHRPDAKELSFSPYITEDGQYLIMSIGKGTAPENRVYYRPLNSAKDFIKLIDTPDASYYFITNKGTTFYFQSNLNAPRNRIIAIDINTPARKNWKTVLAESKDPIASIDFIADRFVVSYLHNVHSVVKVYDIKGKYLSEIPLPTLGTVHSITGKEDDSEMFFSFSSYLYPTTTYRHDFLANKTKVFRRPQIDFDPKPYKTKQVFYRSKDGTRIPMFITHKKGIKLNGKNPTILYGYGGFNVSLEPRFSPTTAAWLEQGGIFAVANLRGGEEYGEEWHKAGMLHNKQNVFDDFHAAAKYLIRKGYTSPNKLAIQGGSNGGLLVAATMLQKPKLYGAVICEVPVIDMLRYHKMGVGRFWVPEYGNAERNAEDFKTLYAYSPLHNIKPDTDYPPIMVRTADTDDRVVPAHSKKFAAAMQQHSPGNNPILLRVITKAGHGAGKPIQKMIEEETEVFAFLRKTLNMKD